MNMRRSHIWLLCSDAKFPRDGTSFPGEQHKIPGPAVYREKIAKKIPNFSLFEPQIR